MIESNQKYDSKRVIIWDMDWYYKFSFSPNPKAQQLSSYHKQLGDIVHLAEEEHHLQFEHDLMYIIRERRSTPMPPIKYIDVNHVRLIGGEFRYYNNKYSIPEIVSMVRPDYSLYKIPETNRFANSHILQLMHGTTPIKKRQDHRNLSSRRVQRTIVVDEHLWKASEENIIYSLNELKHFRNIMFLKRISLKRLIESKTIRELFLELDLASYGHLTFRNDAGSEYEDVVAAIELLKELKEKKGNLAIQPIPIKAVLLDHRAAENSHIKDLKRNLKIVDYAKENEIRVVIKTVHQRSDTPYWYLFDMLETWTENYYHMSYIEAMVSTRSLKTFEEWHEIVNDPIKWSTPRINILVQFIEREYDFTKEYCGRKWGAQSIDVELINLNKIKKALRGVGYKQED